MKAVHSGRALRSLALVLPLLFALASCAFEPDMRGVEVVRYTGPPITPDSWRYGWKNIKASVAADGVVTIDWDDSSYESSLRLVLRKSSSGLPAFVESKFLPDVPDMTLVLRSGTIHIEHFDPEGIISGYMEGSYYRGDFKHADRLRDVFWVDLSEPAPPEEEAGGVQ